MMFKRRKPDPAIGRRRSRPQTQRPAAFSYRSSRNDQEYATGRAQPREQDARRRERLVRFWRQRLGVLVAGIIIIACVLNILQLSANPKIIVLGDSATQTFLHPTAVYEQAAGKLFAASLLNRNKITVNTSEVQKKLQQSYPELADVSVTLPLISHRPVVYISAVTPALILSNAGASYVLSESGTVLLAANEASAVTKQKLPVVTDLTSHKITIGSEALSSSDVSFIQTIVGQLTAKDVGIATLTLPNAAYELDVQLAGVPYYVKFNMHDSQAARQQAGTFLAVRERLQGQGVTPSQYIDARLGGRAYYK